MPYGLLLLRVRQLAQSQAFWNDSVIAAGGNVDAVIESFSASNLDDALDLMDVVTAKTDKASVGRAANELEKHPEVSYNFN
jgi:hypothetical protein